MPSYYFNYEFFVPNTATMEVEADTFEEALEKARNLEPDSEGAWEVDYEGCTNTRLYSIDNDDEEIARVNIPESLSPWEGGHVDLFEQLDEATRASVDEEAAGAFDRVVEAYRSKLPPIVEGEARIMLEARQLRQQTSLATGTAQPIRK